MLVLKKDFTPEQKALANDLLLELQDTNHEIEEFASVEVYAIDTYKNKLYLEFEYSSPEGSNTLFGNY